MCSQKVVKQFSLPFQGHAREQQEARLKELRQDPQFYKPLNEQEPPVRFQGGAGCEDAYQRIAEERRNQKLTSAKRDSKIDLLNENRE